MKSIFPKDFIKMGVVLVGIHCVAFTWGLAQTAGAIRGVVRDGETGERIPYANVRIKDTPLGAASLVTGEYVLGSVTPGTYAVVVSVVGYETAETEVQVRSGETARRDFNLRPTAIMIGEVTVYGASLRKERITDAPAAVSVIDAREIARNAGHGQLPKLLETQPGIDIVQSGLFDFNVNTRGFNSSLNRRVLVLIDGRDMATAFLGATEWNGITLPLEEMGKIELVRGPGSALYGANAYKGVINITSLPPRTAPGTRVLVGIGELSTYRADVRHAGIVGSWSYRVNLGGYSGKTLARSRKNFAWDYPALENPRRRFHNEEVDLIPDPVRSMYGSLRVDYEYETGGTSTIEVGTAQVENEVMVTGIGRVQVRKAQRPWARIGYTSYGFNAMLWTAGRINIKPELSLSTGLDLSQDAQVTHGEVQYHFTALENKLHVVAGASHRLIDIDAKGTLMLGVRNDNMSGLFAQAEYKYSSTLKAVVATRWDRSTLHSDQFSPKAGVVWTPLENHTVRATMNRAFQAPNYSELFLHVKHPFLAVAYYGNLVKDPPGLVGFVGGVQPGTAKDLTVEKIIGYELGYKGVFGQALYLTVDAFYTQLYDFVTDLAPGVNPRFPAEGLYAAGEPFARRAIWSYINAGKVNEAGLEIGANYYLSPELLLSANGSYLWHEVVEQHQNDFLLPNSPKYRLAGGVTYNHPDGHTVGADVRHVPGFPWAAGIYRGDIPAYTILNIAGTYRYLPNLSFNLNISNALDARHIQIFGGSLIGRRVVLTTSYTL